MRRFNRNRPEYGTKIERAFVDGRLAFSRVREVTRVARPEDEAQWLRLASELPMRVLERRVAEASGSAAADPRTSDAADVEWKTPDVVEVRVTLRAESWALLQRAMEGARRADEGNALLSDGEALEAVARDAMGAQAAIDGQAAIGGKTTTAGADVRRTVVLYECKTCQRTEIETGAGPIEVGDVAAAALGCGAAIIDLATEGRLERRGGPLPTAVARAVRLRDRDRCRVPGCSRRRYVDVHHLIERARGGVHSRKNCLCLCGTHHRMLHERQLVITGDPEGAIDFFDGAGRQLADARATDGVTHSGSSGDAAPMVSGEGRRLLATMGARGGWSADDLCEATGLPAATVASTLIFCELAGQVRRDEAGRYQALH